jgi:ABC-type lipoprotein export system ATPase subunit
MPEPILELRRVMKSFLSGDVRISVLREASIAILPGETVGIVGPSGSGKSTVLNLLGSLDQPDEGAVLLEGRDMTQLSPSDLAKARNRDLGFVFQAHHLLPHCTVLENVLIPTMAATGRAPIDAPTRAKALLNRVGLGQRLDHLPGRLSGGERQRAAVVRALINQPRVLLADEPTGALDRASAKEIARLLVEINAEQGVTVVIVTHSIELAELLQRSVEVREGRLEPRILR